MTMSTSSPPQISSRARRRQLVAEHHPLQARPALAVPVIAVGLQNHLPAGGRVPSDVDERFGLDQPNCSPATRNLNQGVRSGAPRARCVDHYQWPSAELRAVAEPLLLPAKLWAVRTRPSTCPSGSGNTIRTVGPPTISSRVSGWKLIEVPGGCGAFQRCTFEGLPKFSAVNSSPSQRRLAQPSLQGRLVDPGDLHRRPDDVAPFVGPDRLLHRVPGDEQPVQRMRVDHLDGPDGSRGRRAPDASSVSYRQGGTGVGRWEGRGRLGG